MEYCNFLNKRIKPWCIVSSDSRMNRLFLVKHTGHAVVSSPFIKASDITYYWIALLARSHCLSSIFMHYILNSPPPTKIISSLHKIQIIGEWHDLTNLKHLMVDVKAQGEALFSSWFLPLAGWPCFSMKVYILSLINLATQWIFWQASLFSPIISPIMDHVVRSPTLCSQYLELRSVWTYRKDFVAVLVSI